MSTIEYESIFVGAEYECSTYYGPGGYHPVLLNDTFQNGRYRVVHKLGYGSYATVWLVEDNITNRYAALKILIAEVSKVSQELQICKIIHETMDNGTRHVVQVLDEFEIEGPNGKHSCIVTEVLGPNLRDYLHSRPIPIAVAGRLSGQIARGLEYLHGLNIVHGDLHLGNILLSSPLADKPVSSDVLYKLFGEPEIISCLTPISHIPPSHPKYLVAKAIPHGVHKVMEPNAKAKVHVKIVDFGESFIWDPATPLTRKLHIPNVYAAPEVLLKDSPGPASDIWSFAVVCGMLFSEFYLFHAFSGTADEVLCSMNLKLGPLPPLWWEKWEGRHEYFDDDGGYKKGRQRIYTRQLPVWKIFRGEENQRVFDNALVKMVKYEPHERITASQIVESFSEQWMNSVFEEEMAAPEQKQERWHEQGLVEAEDSFILVPSKEDDKDDFVWKVGMEIPLAWLYQ